MIDGLIDLVFGKSKITSPIFVKEFSKENEHLKKLSEIEDTIVDEKMKKDIQLDKKLIEIGLQGEANVAFELKNSLLPILCLHDINLNIGGHAAQMDFVVLTNKSIIILETKKLYGDIEITKDGDFIRILKNKNGRIYKREGMYSPISQNKRQVRVLEKILKDRGLIRKVPVKSYVILANPKTILYKKSAPSDIQKNIYKYEHITRILKKELDAKTNINIADKQLYEIADFLKNNHQPSSFNTEKYYTKEAVEKEIIADPTVTSDTLKHITITEALTNYRTEVSKREKLRAYMVFTNREMEDLIEANPRSLDDLLKVRGFGKVKVEKYGNDLIELLREYNN